MRKRILSIVGAAALTLGVTACSSSSDTGSTESIRATGGFWGVHGAQGASEADPPMSLTAIAERADLVVLGTVSGAEEGKDYTEEGKPPNRTSNLSIGVEQSSDTGVSEAVVEITRDTATSLTDIQDNLPKGRYVFYLSTWYDGPDGPVYRCASPAKCVVGVEEGDLETPRDPEAAEELQVPAEADQEKAAKNDSLTVEQVYDLSAEAVPASGSAS